MQYLVTVGRGQEREEKIHWLHANGYKGNISEDYPYGVIVIEGEFFFGGNVTCFAASVSCGNKVLSWEEWKNGINK